MALNGRGATVKPLWRHRSESVCGSQWVVSGAIVHDANGPRRDASGKPDIRYFFFPTKDGVYSVIFEKSRLSVSSKAHLNKVVRHVVCIFVFCV